MPFVVGLSGAAVLLMLTPRLQARQIMKLAAVQGEFRAGVDDSGVRVTTDNSSTVVGWQAQPRYVETAEQFVLLSPDKNAVGFTVLPKRGHCRAAGDTRSASPARLSTWAHCSDGAPPTASHR
jgi:hypothetical protein